MFKFTFLFEPNQSCVRVQCPQTGNKMDVNFLELEPWNNFLISVPVAVNQKLNFWSCTVVTMCGGDIKR
jgi:hypothetical protein